MKSWTRAAVVAAVFVVALDAAPPQQSGTEAPPPWAYGFTTVAGSTPQAPGAAAAPPAGAPAPYRGHFTETPSRQHASLYIGPDSRWLWAGGLVSARSSADAGNRGAWPQARSARMLAMPLSQWQRPAGKCAPRGPSLHIFPPDHGRLQKWSEKECGRAQGEYQRDGRLRDGHDR